MRGLRDETGVMDSRSPRVTHAALRGVCRFRKMFKEVKSNGGVIYIIHLGFFPLLKMALFFKKKKGGGVGGI